MASLAAASDKAVEELENGLGGVAFIPAGRQGTHKVFNTFMFRVGKRPEATTDGLDTYKGFLPENEKKIFENLSLSEPQVCPNIDVRTLNHQSKVAVGVSGEIAKKGALTVGLKGKKNVTYEMKITNVSSISVRQENKIGLRDLIERNCRSIAEADTAIRGILTQNNGIENGFSDVIFGIAHCQVTGRVETFNLGAKGKETVGGEIGGGGTSIQVGVSSKPDKSLERGPTEGTVALNFFALHIRRANAGSNEIAPLSSVFNVSKSKEDLLLDAFRRTMAGLKKLQKAKKRKVVARVFRRLGKDDGNILDPPDPLLEDVANQRSHTYPSAMETDNPESAESEDSDAYMSAVEANDDDDFDSERLGYVNSRHILLEREPKSKMAGLIEQVRKGPTEYDGMMITQLAPVRYYDISGFLPIYYNPANSGDEDLTVPSYVLCYKAVHPDHWCLRPVEHGGKPNKEVVTMYSKEWRVRESVVRVREEHKDLQAMLESIGFHILEQGQDGDLEEPDGEGPFIMMGRHELTRFHDLGTPLSEIEYRKGYVQMKGHNEGKASAPEATDLYTIDREQTLTSRAVTLSSVDSPDRKKQKIGD